MFQKRNLIFGILFFFSLSLMAGEKKKSSQAKKKNTSQVSDTQAKPKSASPNGPKAVVPKSGAPAKSSMDKPVTAPLNKDGTPDMRYKANKDKARQKSGKNL